MSVLEIPYEVCCKIKLRQENSFIIYIIIYIYSANIIQICLLMTKAEAGRFEVERALNLLSRCQLYHNIRHMVLEIRSTASDCAGAKSEIFVKVLIIS